ncbi:MAG: hypothetical protein FJX57_01335 [Alphaproteobacteria bacterium]|nr:hypothetical protein [Alphaproteobacteria bacterium]
MSYRRFRVFVSLVVAVALALPLGSCESAGEKQTAGTVIGGVGGAVLGGVVGSAVGGRGAVVVGAVAGGILGAWAGSAIGKRLDERDRQKAAAATQRVLAQPRPANWQPPSQRTTTSRSSTTTPSNDSSTQAQQSSSSGWSSAWRSDQNQGVRGNSSVVAVTRNTEGQECRSVQEVAYIKGEEVKQTTRYCKDSSGRWAQA